jgi:hypothetical protein
VNLIEHEPSSQWGFTMERQASNLSAAGATGVDRWFDLA